MGQLSTSKVALDPSAFIMALKNVIFKAGNTNIDLAQQQGASEILKHVVTELSKDSIFASEFLKVRLKITITCETCIEAQEAEEGSFILKLPVKDNIQSSLLNAFDAEQLQSVFCHFCESRSPAVREHSISDCGKYLIIQLKCFTSKNGHTYKTVDHVDCFPELLSVPVRIDSEVIVQRKYCLVASVNHTGDLERGHYTAFIQNQSS